MPFGWFGEGSAIAQVPFHVARIYIPPSFWCRARRDEHSQVNKRGRGRSSRQLEHPAVRLSSLKKTKAVKGKVMWHMETLRSGFFIAPLTLTWESDPKFSVRELAGIKRWEENHHPPPNTGLVSQICNQNNLCCGNLQTNVGFVQANLLPRELPARLPQHPEDAVSLGCTTPLPPAPPCAAGLHRKPRISAVTRARPDLKFFLHCFSSSKANLEMIHLWVLSPTYLIQ